MPASMEVDFSGVTLRLFAARGAYWREQQTLFVADTHFGKEATFRRHSIPVPRGSTNGTLARLTDMLVRTTASSLVILGDMFHARSSLSVDVCDSLETFFADHPGLRITLVRGNHDAGIGQLPSSWPIEIVEPGETMGTVALGHQPTKVPDNASLLLCGHLHPAIRFGSMDDQIKLPCFWQSRQRIIFPAIGEFTGTELVRPSSGDRAWVVTEDQIVEHTVHRKL